MPQITTEELFSGVKYQPLTLGTTTGILRIMRNPEDEVEARDVAVFEKTPNDIGPLAALITSDLQAPLAHTALLCSNRGTPNVGIPGIWSDPKVLALEGKPVKLVVKADNYELTEAILEDIVPKLVEPVTLPEADLSTTSLMLASSGGGCIGAKARQYGELEVLALKPKRRIAFGYVMSEGKMGKVDLKPPMMFTTLESFVVPFGCAAAHLKSAVPDVSPDKMRSHGKGELHDRILVAPVDPALLDNIVQKLATWQAHSQRFIFRSSTNCEDLPGFNGAGLYKSVPAGVSAGEVADALRKVWASVWSERARAERKMFGIDDAQVAVAVLVQPFVDKALANGVALTSNPRALRRVNGVLLNSSAGTKERVTDGGGSEEIFVHFERTLGEMDVQVNACKGAAVLDAGAARGVAAACFWMHQQYEQQLAKQGACLDIEYLLTDVTQSPMPVRRWFYLGGYFPDGQGGQTTDPHYPLRFPASCWQEYSRRLSRQLSLAYEHMQRQPNDRAHGRLLDIAKLKESLDYEVWKGKEVVVATQGLLVTL